jgi:hypothetical protein
VFLVLLVRQTGANFLLRGYNNLQSLVFFYDFLKIKNMNNIDFNDYYLVNPAYKFRSDIKRIVLTNNNSMYVNIYDRIRKNFTSSFSTIMHPYMAYLFSFFDGTGNLNETVKKISQILDKSEEDVRNTFLPFINNEKSLLFPLSDKYYAAIPDNFIVKKGNFDNRDLLKSIDIETMLTDVDLESVRYYIVVPYNSINHFIFNEISSKKFGSFPQF